MSEPARRLTVPKTYKLFIGGKFPRSESGRYLKATSVKNGSLLANYSHASKKDLRDAVSAARSAQAGWSNTTPYLRGQVLYRAAEMIESRAASIAGEITANSSQTQEEATSEVTASIDRLVHFAGWTDKLQQVFSNVNPVSSPHFNFSQIEPVGVVAVTCPDALPLLPLVSLAAEVVLTGNTVVLVASESSPLPALALAEALATSDLPAGVVNILTGKRAELAPTLASHMDINALVEASGDPLLAATLRAGSSHNLKRVFSRSVDPAAWQSPESADPYRILDTTETKAAWHPVGL